MLKLTGVVTEPRWEKGHDEASTPESRIAKAQQHENKTTWVQYRYSAASVAVIAVITAALTHFQG